MGHQHRRWCDTRSRGPAPRTTGASLGSKGTCIYNTEQLVSPTNLVCHTNRSFHVQAVEVLKPDATGIYVAAHQAPAAIEEAIEAEVPLIVAVAEHVPLHDILRVSGVAKHRLVHGGGRSYMRANGRELRFIRCSRPNPHLDW